MTESIALPIRPPESAVSPVRPARKPLRRPSGVAPVLVAAAGIVAGTAIRGLHVPLTALLIVAGVWLVVVTVGTCVWSWRQR